VRVSVLGHESTIADLRRQRSVGAEARIEFARGAA
jgi:hypothetical protein